MTASATNAFLAFIEPQRLTFEKAKKAAHAAARDPNYRESPLFAESTAPRAMAV